MLRQNLLFRRVSSMLLSVVVLAIALSVLWIGHNLKASMPDTVTVREIAIFMPPPPPPPPPSTTQQSMIDVPITVQVQGKGSALKMVNIKKQQIDIAKPDVLTIDIASTQWQSLEVNWDAFDLNDLDSFPTLLSSLRVVFPRSLTRKGINYALVKLDVLIDEEGSVSLISVVKNPYPELNPEIHKLVRNSRFTSPTKDNLNVRARFIWPIEIKS